MLFLTKQRTEKGKKSDRLGQKKRNFAAVSAAPDARLEGLEERVRLMNHRNIDQKSK
jgi:hypothetical protein